MPISLLGIVEAITISEWVVIFLVTKPLFILSAIVAFVWSRRGRTEAAALPGPEQTQLLESEEPT